MKILEEKLRQRGHSDSYNGAKRIKTSQFTRPGLFVPRDERAKHPKGHYGINKTDVVQVDHDGNWLMPAFVFDKASSEVGHFMDELAQFKIRGFRQTGDPEMDDWFRERNR